MRTPAWSFIPVRRALLAVGVVAVAAVAGARALLVATGEASSDAAGLHLVEVEMEMAGFEPSLVRVPAGRPFVLRLHTPESPFELEGPTHQRAIDELGVDLRIGAGETAEARLGPVEAGTYEFYCDLCCSGRANPAMIGTLVVTG